jgi:hypothetical protein
LPPTWADVTSLSLSTWSGITIFAYYDRHSRRHEPGTAAVNGIVTQLPIKVFRFSKPLALYFSTIIIERNWSHDDT